MTKWMDERNPGAMRRLVIATVLALVATALAAAGPARPAAAVDRPPGSTFLITWNMQGAGNGEDHGGKWQNTVVDYAHRVPIVLIQEAGPTPPPGAAFVADLTRTTTGQQGTITTHTVLHRRWTIGANRHGSGGPETREVYFLQTQDDSTNPRAVGGRVNLAIVTPDEPDEVTVVGNPVNAGRVALGVRFGAHWYFTVHGLSGGGGDSGTLVNAIDDEVERLERVRRVTYTHTVGGDFNVDPDVLAGRDSFPPSMRILNSDTATHQSGNELDYFATSQFGINPRVTRLDGANSDHYAVQFGNLRAAGEYPIDLRLGATGDELTQGYGSPDLTGYRDELDASIGKLTLSSLFGTGDGLGGSIFGKRDFVGYKRDGLIPDPDHEGWPGATIGEIADNSAGDLAGNLPNVVTLLAGTNDIVDDNDLANAPKRLDDYVERVYQQAPGVTVILATLPRSANPAYQQRIAAFNDGVRAFAQRRLTEGDRFVLVDLSALTPDDLADEIHPDDAGYDKIAEAFLAGLRIAVLRGLIDRPAEQLPPRTVGQTDRRAADPSVIRVGDTYWSVEASHPASGAPQILLRSWRTLGTRPVSSAGTVIWEDGDDLGEIWAPELVRLNGLFYVYFSAGRGAAHRMYSMSSSSLEQPEFRNVKKMDLPGDKWAIDGTAFRFDDQFWFVWSGWEGDENTEQNLYLVRLAHPTMPVGERYVISQPREPWERKVGDPFINEAPEPILDPDGRLHITYAANGSWSDRYCVGEIRLRAGGDPTYVWDWYKSNGCLFGSHRDTMMKGYGTTQFANGPGHHSFVLLDGDIATSPPAGQKFPLMYHAVPKGADYAWGNRVWYSGGFTWWKDITYRRAEVPGANTDQGYSLGFFEDAGSPLPPPPVTGAPGQTGLRNADPSVARIGSDYYSVESDGTAIYSRRAGTVAGLANAPRVPIWDRSPGLENVWAPELVQMPAALGSKVYAIYFAAGDGKGGQRMKYTWSNNPGSAYGEPLDLKLPGDTWAVDGTAFDFGGQLWFVWSGWEGDTDVEQNLYLARMAGPSEVTGDRYVISQPREPWERAAGNPFINEAPQALKDPDGRLHIVYSANGSWTDQYCVGEIRLRAGGDPTQVWDWYKSNGCLFGSHRETMMPGWDPTLHVDGPGHPTFALQNGDINQGPPAGPTFPMMFHAVGKGTPYAWENREWFTGTFCWWGDVTYRRSNVPGPGDDRGWGLKLFE